MAKQSKMSSDRAPAQVPVIDTQSKGAATVPAAQEPAAPPPSEAHLLATEAGDELATSQVDLLAQVRQLQAQLRSAQFEGKMHKDAWTSAASKYDALSAKIDQEMQDQAIMSAKMAHIIKLIRTAYTANSELWMTQSSFDVDGWRQMYQQLLSVFEHRE